MCLSNLSICDFAMLPIPLSVWEEGSTVQLKSLFSCSRRVSMQAVCSIFDTIDSFVMSYLLGAVAGRSGPRDAVETTSS